MKYLLFIVFLLSISIQSQAQQAGQLYITSYDDTGQIVWVCGGQANNSVPVQYGLINLNQNVPLTIDSVVPSGDPLVFLDQAVTGTLALGDVGVSGNALFSPSEPGDDTIHETVYYNGQFTATASIIFHARTAPNLAMYGDDITTAYSFDGEGFGSLITNAFTDTLIDWLSGSSGDPYYYVSSTPVENGGFGPGDNPVILRGCGGSIIDSIYEVGDFSDFAFDPFPSLPFSMPSNDSLILNYEFTPKMVDSTGVANHYLVFHSTDGQYLVWDFKYQILPSAGVNLQSLENQFSIFPNPASSELDISAGPSGTARVFDLLGRELLEANDDGSGVALDVSHLTNGTYFLRLGTWSSKKIVISH